MSRGPGRVERSVKETLRNTDRSYTVEELARIAYPDAATIEKKHRVSVLRAIPNVQNKVPLWFFNTYTPPWRLIFTNRDNVRSYAHGLLRASWWNAERTLEQIEMILADPDIQSIMEPGGFWWAEVEIHKREHGEWEPFKKASVEAGLAEYDGRCWSMKETAEMPSEVRTCLDEISTLNSYRSALARQTSMHVLLGRFEPPGTPVFEFAMKHRDDKEFPEQY